MKVYIVEREGGNGLESNIFLDKKLATRWANATRGVLYTDTMWTQELVDELLEHWENDNTDK